jgi:hypothetical protein
MRRKLPSPATLIALLALFAALGGSAVALKGKNTVDSGDVKNGQIKSKDLKDGNVTGKDVKDDSLTGADIDESSLAVDVPREVIPISLRIGGGSPPQTALDVNGLKLDVTCKANGEFELRRTNPDGVISFENRTFSSSPTVLGGPVTNGLVLNAIPNSAIDEEITFRRASDGATVTSDMTFVTTDSVVGTDCVLMGNALAARP